MVSDLIEDKKLQIKDRCFLVIDCLITFVYWFVLVLDSVRSTLPKSVWVWCSMLIRGDFLVQRMFSLCVEFLCILHSGMVFLLPEEMFFFLFCALLILHSIAFS